MNGLHGFGAGIKFVNGLYQANDIRSVNALQRHRGKAICNLLLILAELPPAKEYTNRCISLYIYIYLYSPQMRAGVQQGYIKFQQINITERIKATDRQ